MKKFKFEDKDFIKLPKDFQLGGAISSLQTEPRSKGWVDNGLVAGLEPIKTSWEPFLEQDKSICFDNIGEMENFKPVDFAKKMGEIGLNSIRTGFSWARLFPDGVNLDKKAELFYHKYIDVLKENGIEPIMTLFHFDMPLWAQLKGGWSSQEVIDKFNKYAEFVFETYYQDVDKFVTFNEPLVPIIGGYMGKNTHPPFTNNWDEALRQELGMFSAHFEAIKTFRKLQENNKIKKSNEIGMAFNWNISKPYCFGNVWDIEASNMHDKLINRGVFETMLFGFSNNYCQTYSYWMFNYLSWDNKNFTSMCNDFKDKYRDFHFSLDFVGINYYFPSRVSFKEKESCNNVKPFEEMFDLKIPEGARINPHRGWEIYPKGLYEIATILKRDYGNIKWYVSENGMGVENEQRFLNEDGIIEDDYRIEFIQDHLKELSKAIDEGSNCFGYHLWAPIDCWSFRNAFKNRYGLVDTELKRKKSSYWYEEQIKRLGEKDGE